VCLQCRWHGIDVAVKVFLEQNLSLATIRVRAAGNGLTCGLVLDLLHVLDIDILCLFVIRAVVSWLLPDNVAL
jgi:hypothetical protein